MTGSHWTGTGTTSYSTSTVRSGARSFRTNPTAGNAYGASPASIATSGIHVGRQYLYIATAPGADTVVCGFKVGTSASLSGLGFQASDSKWYAAEDGGAGVSFGATGVTIATGSWVRVDIKVISTANPWLIDVSVDGVALGQCSLGLTANTNPSDYRCGNYQTAATFDIFHDDVVVSTTSGDYPIGAGLVQAFIPTSDGTHNVAGAADFRRSATTTDITNSTTDAYLLVSKQPLDVTSAAPTTYINLIAPPNATDYVETKAGAATGSTVQANAPRAVEVLVGYAAASVGTCNIRLALNDNGTTSDVFNGNPATTNTNTRYTTKQYATAPTGGAWNAGTSGAAAFNNLRMRCLTNDAAPDPFFACWMIEAEFAPAAAGRSAKNTRETDLGMELGMNLWGQL